MLLNLNGIKTLIANTFINFFIHGNPIFNNEPRSLPKNPSDYIILDNCVFDSIVPVDELFAKALRRFATCLLVNNNLCGKLVSSLELPTIFHDSLKTTLVSFFIADFSLLSWEFDSFTFKLLYCVILY